MMMMQEAMPPIRSPMPGIKPTMPSSPKRIDVPGILMKSSSTCDSRSRFSSSNGLPPRFMRGDSTSRFRGKCHRTPIFSPAECPRRSTRCYNSQYTAAIVQWQNAALWQRMSWVRTPLAAPNLPLPRHTAVPPCLAKSPQLAATALAARHIFTPEPPAGPIPPGSPTSIQPHPAKSFLEFYASQLTSVEVNYTFRALPTPRCSKAGSPPPLPTSDSASKRRSASPTSNGCAIATPTSPSSSPRSSPSQAGKLGLLLFQLPPNFKADPSPSPTSSPFPRFARKARRRSHSNSATSPGSPKRPTPSCASTTPRSASPKATTSLTPEVHTATTYTCFRLRRNGGYSPVETRRLRHPLYRPRRAARCLRLLQARGRTHRRAQRRRLPRPQPSRQAVMQPQSIETIAGHADDFQPRRFLSNGHLQTIARQLSPARQPPSASPKPNSSKSPPPRRPNRQPGSLPLPLAARRGPRHPAHRHHRARP